MKNILLEGNPGAGKTTLLQTIAERISYLSVGGFYTEEVREQGGRVGFRVETFNGQSGILSHIAYETGPRVAKYRVDVSAFEEIGVNGLEKAFQVSDIIMIDEIGKMELFSTRFKEIVLRCFDSTKPVIATVMSHPNLFVDRLKARPDVQLFTVSFENRNELGKKIIENILR